MGAWRSPSPSREREGTRAENWGSIRLNGDDTLSGAAGGDDSDAKSSKSKVYVRNVGMGIEGRSAPTTPIVQEDGSLLHRTPKSARRASGSSVWTWASARGTLGGNNVAMSSKARKGSGGDDAPEDSEPSTRRSQQAATTLALLQTFQANTDSLLARLAELLPERSAHSHNMANVAGSGPAVVLTPKDLMSFDLGPLSGLDGRFVEWLVEVYGSGARVAVRRNWRDVVALLFGLS